MESRLYTKILAGPLRNEVLLLFWHSSKNAANSCMQAAVSKKKQLFVFSTQFSAAFHLLVEKSIYVPTQRQQIKKASSVVYTDTKQ